MRAKTQAIAYYESLEIKPWLMLAKAKPESGNRTGRETTNRCC
jgi:hypothetical protein